MNEKQRQEKIKKIKMMRQYAYRYYFTSEARQRLGNIKMVRPKQYTEIIDLSIRFARDGHLTSPITDNELKELLKQMNEQKKSTDIKFRRW